MDIKIIIGTIVRGAMQGLAGWLVLKGVIDADAASHLVDATTGVVVGVIALAGTYIWSLISKKKALDEQPPIK